MGPIAERVPFSDGSNVRGDFLRIHISEIPVHERQQIMPANRWGGMVFPFKLQPGFTGLAGGFVSGVAGWVFGKEGASGWSPWSSFAKQVLVSNPGLSKTCDGSNKQLLCQTNNLTNRMIES